MSSDEYSHLNDAQLIEHITNLEYVLSRIPEGVFRKAFDDQLAKLHSILAKRRAGGETRAG